MVTFRHFASSYLTSDTGREINYNLLCVDIAGLYCSGWVKTGPVGVIVSTMNNAFETGKAITTDLEQGSLLPTEEHVGKQLILEELKEKGMLILILS